MRVSPVPGVLISLTTLVVICSMSFLIPMMEVSAEVEAEVPRSSASASSRAAVSVVRSSTIRSMVSLSSVSSMVTAVAPSPSSVTSSFTKFSTEAPSETEAALSFSATSLRAWSMSWISFLTLVAAEAYVLAVSGENVPSSLRPTASAEAISSMETLTFVSSVFSCTTSTLTRPSSEVPVTSASMLPASSATA